MDILFYFIETAVQQKTTLSKEKSNGKVIHSSRSKAVREGTINFSIDHDYRIHENESENLILTLQIT